MEDVVGFSRAVRVGPVLAIGGTAPVDADGRTVGPGDMRAQATRCFEIADQALRDAGSGWAHVIRTRLLLTDLGHWREAVEVRRTYCLDAKPVDTIMGVTGFVNPEWLIEIEVDAVVPPG
ncbi:RidA family protein [Rhodobacteraceae bacterium KN286]|uniref:RidA family protein n=2 Tax=Oceanomicrobium pacificus TaxID=2692916 RepID=A0A6B0TRU6_9RHOB|nr:RidA family protein [Oceanomicrobium pacificus]